MRKYRFGLSDMVPNSWFCKLKGIVTGGRRRSRGQQAQNSKRKSQAPKTAERKSSETQRLGFALPAPSPKQIFLANRSSNYVASRERAEMLPQCLTPQKVADALFPLDTPRKTKPKPCKKHPSYSINPLQIPVSSLSACSFPNSEFQSDANEAVSTAECHVPPSPGNEMNIDVFNVVAERSLHPIATKPERKEPNRRALLATKLSSKQGNVRNASPGLHKIKVRAHSPRLAKRVPRKGLTESYVMVKTSTNPQKDFLESMVEMIVENNLLSSKDLEELLACYLSLNSKEYHDMIVKVFEQIWLALA